MSEDHRFHFRALRGVEAEQADSAGDSSSRIRGLCPMDEREFALVYGRLLTLFGQPRYLSSDLENQYCYSIEAVDEQNNIRYLQAYSGSTGPAVGGGGEELDRLAADQLVKLVRSAEPSDYEYTGYYLDGPCKVYMCVKCGQALYEESELTDEDFREMNFQ